MADIEGRIRIKRGDLSSRSESTISAGTPIIDTKTKELYISINDKVALNKCGIRVNEAKNVISGGKVAGDVILGTTTDVSSMGNRHPDNIFEINSNTVKNATNVVSTINGHKINDIMETNGTTVKNTTNVTTNINGHPISTIFEDDGITVKKAINSKNATIASNAEKINNYTVTKDSNGLLKVDDVIVCQKQLLSTGAKGKVDLTSFNLKAGDILEIETSFDSTYVTKVEIGSSSKSFWLSFVNAGSARGSVLIGGVSVYYSTKSVSIGMAHFNGLATDNTNPQGQVYKNYTSFDQGCSITKVWRIIE